MKVPSKHWLKCGWQLGTIKDSVYMQACVVVLSSAILQL